MNKLPATEFEKGFICAVSIMFRSHGLGVAATAPPPSGCPAFLLTTGAPLGVVVR